MGYYIRVLGTKLNEIPLKILRASASPALIEAETGDGEAWEGVALSHPDGMAIARIGRNLVEEGELGAEELQEFLEDVPRYRPQSAARWLVDYFSRVTVIYAFQVLSGAIRKWRLFLLHQLADLPTIAPPRTFPASHQP